MIEPMNDPSLEIDALCATAIRIDVVIGAQNCGSATGFFYKRSPEKAFFVTNWHVVTGRSPAKPGFSNGGTPRALELTLHRRFGETGIKADHTVTRTIEINSEDGNDPAWLEHPEWRHRADVVVIPVPAGNPALSDDVIFYTIEEVQLWSGYIPRVMQDVFILGFPWGLSAGGAGLPVFKRGSIASAPVVEANSLPRLLVDCRTAKGMSGAPVLGRDEGPYDSEAGIFFGPAIGFLGVYSGRLEGKEETSEIGVVWRAKLIEEIIESGVRGSSLTDLAGI